MTEKEFKEILDTILPPVAGGVERPKDPIPTDLDFSTKFPQLLQADLNLANHENAFLRRLFSNDKLLDEAIEEIQNQLSNCDLRTATQILQGLMSAVDKKKLDGIAEGATKYSHPENHPAKIINQDSTHRFVTDSEKTNWNDKADANHGNHIPAPQTADNSKFLRNDNTWQSVTPKGIGAAPAGYGLGEYQVPGADPDKALLGGIYRSVYNPSNIADNTMMLTMGLNSDYTAQIFVGMNTRRAFLRTRAEGKQNGLLREFAMVDSLTEDIATHNTATDAHASKANCNADNFTSAGKKVISNLSMPSNTFETLTPTFTGTLSNTFVAPANGYYYIVAVASASNSYIGAINQSTGMVSVSHGVSATTGMNAFIPAKKGDNVKFSMQFATNLSIKFIYAEGEV